MACPGSANLELAIPGYVEPLRDDMAGAKGVGTQVHECLEILGKIFPYMMFNLHDMLMVFQAVHWRERYAITVDLSTTMKWVEKNWTAGTMDKGDISLTALWLKMVGEARFPPKMMRFMAEACKYMAELLGDLGADMSDVFTELKMKATWLESAPETTADVVIACRRTLDVVDYKSGAIPVEVEDNDQLLFYAASAYDRFQWTDLEFITMHILQPGNLVSWTVSVKELEAWMEKARRADKRVTAKVLTLRPNDHCTFCPANPHTRGDKANVFCGPMYELLYPPRVDEQEIFDM
jgi:hypothetical protein